MLLSIALLLTWSSHSEQTLTNKANQQALQQTIETLTNQAKRQKALEGSTDAQRANKQAADIAGNEENLNQMYRVTASVFEEIAKENGGEFSNMSEQVSNAMKDPEKFFNSLSPKNRALIQNLVKDINNLQVPTNSPAN